MSKTYVTSDIHLMHQNILAYCPDSRGHFVNEVEMTDQIIVDWNNTVHHDDVVWILGDVTMGHKDHMLNNLKKLKGHKRLVLGNHDFRIKKQPELQACFESIDKYKEISVQVDEKKVFVCMMHYPLAMWNAMGQGAVMLHGHCHGTPTGIPGRIKDVGMDTNNMKLYVLEDVVRELIQIPIARSHHDADKI